MARLLLGAALLAPAVEVSTSGAVMAQPPGGQTPQGPGDQPSGANLKIENDFVTFSVDETEGYPLLEFIKLTEQVTGRVFTFEAQELNSIPDPNISFVGTVRMRIDEFFGFFQTMLFIKNFALVPRGDGNIEMNQIVNLNTQGRQQVTSGAIYVPTDQIPLYARQTGVQVLTTVRLKHINAQAATNSLRPFFAGSGGTSTVVFGNVGDNRSLLLSGFGPQVNSFYQLIQLVDLPAEEEDILIRVQPLIHAPAEEVQPVLESILTDRRRTTPATGASGGALAAQEIEFKIEPLLSQNALILSGTADQIAEAQDLIARLDKPTEASNSDIHVVPLRNVLAEDLEPILSQFLQQDEQAEQQAQAQAGQGAQRRPRSVVIEAHPESNSLLISATTTRFKQVLALIEVLDQRQRQVLIEAAIVELTTDDTRNIAVELGFLDIADNGDFTRPFGFTSQGISSFEDTDGDGLPDTRLPDFANPLQGLTGGIVSGDDFAIPVLVNLLETDSRANILSIPSVLVNNNANAFVTTNEIRPTVNNTQNNVGNQAGLGPERTAGIELRISPTISSNSFLRLNINLIVSRFDGAFDPSSVTGGGVEIARTIQTQVTMPSNDTMVLGGVVEDRESESDSGVPILKDIPVLGYLFRSSTTSRTKVNLYFFVTPIILDEEDFSDLWEVTYRRKLDAEGYIGTDRLRIADKRWRGLNSVNPTLEDAEATIEDLDVQGGNDTPFYRRRYSDTDPYVQGQGPNGPRTPTATGGGN